MEAETSPCACVRLVAGCACVVLAWIVVRSGGRAVAYLARFALYFGLVSALTALVIPPFLLRPFSVDNSTWAADLLMRHVTKPLGISWTLRGQHHLAVKRGGVVVANHQSTLDVLGMFQMWRTLGRVSAVAKKEMFVFWPFGLAAWLGGVVFIDRQRPDSAKRQLEESSKLMLTHKTKLWMFPEGTRNAWTNGLLPFKKGAFRLAIDCQVPVLPVVYSPYYFIDHESKHFESNGKMIVKALAPIETKGLTADDVNDLTERTWKAMQVAFDELREEVLAARDLSASKNVFR